MKINWKRILIAAIWSELLLFAIYVLTMKYGGSAGRVIAALEMFVLMFLGGLWVARKIESRFILHGVLVGILANVLYVALIVVPFNLFRSQSVSHVLQIIPRLIYAVTRDIDTWLKILGATAGAYVGGRRRKKLLSMQDSKV